ncbi:small secreted hydrophilic protein [Streptomyces boluensis]|uniref:Small secreted hydrophilic protein n=1 Tax=Streptomyces boluensis TaxID=1775135 RepID=A0A964UT03_9ACTN|nr:small secreted hydrophilic protein [Streptomyces boluensis]NBE53578.1 small secreted hydrophilic protein [Streptomyces boluensis]
MAFSHRMAALAAVVAIPLGIAATSYALTDSPQSPKVPPKVELDSGSPTPSGPGSASPETTPSDEVVSRPPVSDDPSGDDDDADDKGDDDRGERGTGDGDDG